MGDYINLPLLGKLLVVAVLAPAWVPVVKALWKEINDSLVEQGGIFGDTPDKTEAELLALRRRASGESLQSVTLEAQKQRRSVRSEARSGGPSTRPSASSRGPVKLHKSGRRGF